MNGINPRPLAESDRIANLHEIAGLNDKREFKAPELGFVTLLCEKLQIGQQPFEVTSSPNNGIGFRYRVMRMMSRS